MKVLHISHCDLSGGANRAGFRIFEAQHQAGMDVSMAVAIKQSDHPAVYGAPSRSKDLLARVRPSVENGLRNALRLAKGEAFSLNLLPGSVLDRRLIGEADLLHLHFTGGSPFSLSALRRWGKPIVWTLHDMWAMTAGEHYRPDGDLDAYRGGPRRIERYFYRRKAATYRNLDLRIVCPSRWLADCARRSRLLGRFPVHVVPYAINLGRYRPMPRQQARQLLNLPEEKPLILFGADRGAAAGSRKGFDLLQAALGRLHVAGCDLEAILFGMRDFPADSLPYPVHLPGKLTDDVSLALLYAAADVFVAPSRQDNLPNTVIESLACGTPVVAFKIGGMPDMLEHGVSGHLVQPFDISGLAEGIRLTLEKSRSEPDGVVEACRRRAESLFSPEVIAAAYRPIYAESLPSPRKPEEERS